MLRKRICAKYPVHYVRHLCPPPIISDVILKAAALRLQLCFMVVRPIAFWFFLPVVFFVAFLLQLQFCVRRLKFGSVAPLFVASLVGLVVVGRLNVI